MTEHQLEFLSLKVGSTYSTESTHVKIPHCWKSNVTAQFLTNNCSTFSRVYRRTKLASLTEDSVAPQLPLSGQCLMF